MSARLSPYLLVLLPLLVPGLAPAQEGPDPAIREIQEPPVVDGHLSDWSAAATPIMGRDGSVMGQLRLAFDSSFLYVALSVSDDTLTFPNRSWRFGDGFYLTVLMPETGEASDAHVSLGLSRVGGRLEATVVNRSGKYFPRHSLDGLRFRMQPAPDRTPELSDGAHRWDRPVTYELAVPWHVLAPADPLTVDSLAINVVLVDRDGGRTRRFGMLADDPAFDTERTPVRRGRMLPLVRGIPSAVRVRARVTDPAPAASDSLEVVVAVRTPNPTAGARRIELAVRRNGRLLAREAAAVPGTAGLHRTRVRLPVSRAGTGPATLSVRVEDGPEVQNRVFVVDRAQLARLRTELEAAVPNGAARAALPTAFIRLRWLEDFERTSAPNVPPDRATAWWREYRELAAELTAGSVASLRAPGPHRLGHRSKLDGSLQPYSVYVPSGTPHERLPVLVVLHGSGVTEAGVLRSMGPEAARRGWLVVAPRGRGVSDWWTGPAEIDVLEVLRHAARLYPTDTERTAVVGFSMGGYGVWRFVVRHPTRFAAGVVLAGAACPPESIDGRCIDALLDDPPPPTKRPPILVIHGTRDNAVAVEDARTLVARLAELDWPHEYREIEGAAHGRAGWWMEALDWIPHALPPRDP